MLSLFPSLLAFALLAPVLLRVTIGLYFFFNARRLSSEISHSFLFNIVVRTILIVSSAFIFIGLYTQLAALVLTLLSLFLYFKQTERDTTLILLSIMSLTLVFLGAGFFAFDLPI